MEAAILYLLTSARVGGLTGAIVGLRVYPQDLPQKPQLPAVIYMKVSGPRSYNMDGPGGVTPFRYQFDAIAETVSEAQTLRDAIIADLSGFKGELPTSPAITIQGIFIEDDTDSPEPMLKDQAGRKANRKIVDAIFWTEG